MARHERELPDLRASVPTLEPDDAFLARLAELATGSGTSRPPAGVPSLPGWRVGLAAVSVAAIVGGAAWVATALTGDEAPSPPSPSPATQPSDPGASGSDEDVPTGGSDSGVGRDEIDEPSSSQPGGVPGVSVGPTPDGGQGQQGEDEPPGTSTGPTEDQQGANEPGTTGNQNQNQNPDPPDNQGRDDDDHGQEDGQGDETQGQDGQTHGYAGIPPVPVQTGKPQDGKPVAEQTEGLGDR